MKKLLIASMLCAITASAECQTAGYAIHVDFKTGEAVQVGTVKLGEFKGLKYVGSVDVSSVVALQSNTSLGFAVSKSFAIADNAGFTLGLALRSVQEQGSERVTIRGGVIAGITWKF